MEIIYVHIFSLKKTTIRHKDTPDLLDWMISYIYIYI